MVEEGWRWQRRGEVVVKGSRRRGGGVEVVEKVCVGRLKGGAPGHAVFSQPNVSPAGSGWVLCGWREKERGRWMDRERESQ